ncbi:hypothetical protein ALC57_08105 [Trachymyrmex cornetzi]|uniref:Uncharacterized protein n=1 Tax=Trachymyrmex cornetzi TaxID=471704 RepID=A0A195E446_9HYME|nr:hypothetical protein ALC57_08105 [Trachymyrmex cornetzi]
MHVSNETKIWTDSLVSQKSTSIERRAIKRKRPRKLIIVGIVVPYRGNRESKPDDLFQTGQTSSISFRRPKSPADEDLVQRKEEDCLLMCAVKSGIYVITASDGVATQPRLNHELGVRYDPFYLGCIGATAEVERKPDASESSQLPTFRATAAVDLRNALLLVLGDFISHKDGKGFEGNDGNPRNISERWIPEEK